jgi:SEC-C motif-containing protein
LLPADPGCPWAGTQRRTIDAFPLQRFWLGLRIKDTQTGTPSDSHGTVEFVARFKIHGRGHRLHEISRFEKIDGRWYYLDGQHL